MKQEEIESVAEQFVRKALRYQGDEDLGTIDRDNVHDQLRETVVTALTFDPNAVYHLLGAGVRSAASRVRSYVSTIENIEELVPSITAAPRTDPVTEQAISKIANDKTLHQRMQIAARQRAVERFGVQQNAKKVLDYLAEIVDTYK